MDANKKLLATFIEVNFSRFTVMDEKIYPLETALGFLGVVELKLRLGCGQALAKLVFNPNRQRSSHWYELVLSLIMGDDGLFYLDCEEVGDVEMPWWEYVGYRVIAMPSCRILRRKPRGFWFYHTYVKPTLEVVRTWAEENPTEVKRWQKTWFKYN